MKPERTSLERAVRRAIRGIQRGETGRVADGEAWICPYCEYPVQPCKHDPAYQCPERILGATELKSLLERSREERNGSPAQCLECGKKLSTRELSGDPLRELCGSCQKRSGRKSRAGTKGRKS